MKSASWVCTELAAGAEVFQATGVQGEHTWEHTRDGEREIALPAARHACERSSNEAPTRTRAESHALSGASPYKTTSGSLYDVSVLVEFEQLREARIQTH